MIGLVTELPRIVRRYLADRRGAAAAEFALWTAAFIVPTSSAIDLSFYSYEKMELNNAAQAAAQAAWATCAPSSVPAATKCAGLQTALATAAHSTGLGAAAALQPSTEGFYCLTAAGALQLVGTAGSIPTSGAGTAPTPPSGNCAAQGASFAGNTQSPGDYVQITVHYTYTPLFKGLSVLSLVPTVMSRTAWMRLA
ncbi:MAG TPA: TadE/TadG family type IV pilus assembly protein [Caulobacteraceae bacterium]|jgi:Flp pilus assembly protein TadG